MLSRFGRRTGVKGRKLGILSLLYKPTTGNAVVMLRELKESLQCSQDALAMLLGISRLNLRQWLAGQRRPCRVATRLIWLLHRLHFKGRILKRSDTWLRWL